MIKNPFSLSGKTILVTGASSGIGRATAIELSNAGAKQLILVARNEKELLHTAELLAPDCISTVKVCDLSVSSDVENLVKQLPELDGVVCNAGINKMRPIAFVSDKDMDAIFNVNCFSPVIMIKHLIKKKKLKNGSSIVFTSSIAGNFNITIGNSVYGASKSALTAFMKYIAVELAPKGIRCNCVHPGIIETPLIHTLTDEESINKDVETYPLKRYGRPEEVGYGIVYLLSDASSWITGTSLVIDGGKSLL